ncbi:MAG TPA: alpha/beta fold hydrolase [Acidimicrobiia bacterium]|nr:alpha/beta fold hydrolase [Acidimicrobiia bacterium]
MSDVPLRPSAEPFSVAGGPHGALVLHGFTGNPSSMRGVADVLAAAGFAVELPVLPGHGTSVEDMLTTGFSDWSAAAEAAYLDLADRTDSIVVVGLSMGATLAAWVTARNPTVAGLVAVNGMFEPPAPSFLEMLKAAVAQGLDRFDGIGSDIALPGVSEGAYPATPLRPLISLMEAVTELHGDLGKIRCPVLILTSREDHVVPASSSDVLASAVSGPVERIVLERSYHVATLDYDRDVVEERTVEFARRVTTL